MGSSIKARIISIGNSQGIRIPKILLDQLGLKGEVELEVQANQLVIRPVSSVRQGWDEQFRAMAAQGDDRLLDDEASVPTAWEEQEWEW